MPRHVYLPRIHEQSKCAEVRTNGSTVGTYLAAHVAARRRPYSAYWGYQCNPFYREGSTSKCEFTFWMLTSHWLWCRVAACLRRAHTLLGSHWSAAAWGGPGGVAGRSGGPGGENNPSRLAQFGRVIQTGTSPRIFEWEGGRIVGRVANRALHGEKFLDPLYSNPFGRIHIHPYLDFSVENSPYPPISIFGLKIPRFHRYTYVNFEKPVILCSMYK